MSRLLPRHKNRCWVNTLGGEIPRRRGFCQIKDHKKTKRSSAPGEGLQSWTKMDFAISSFKIEPFKALAITNTSPSPPPTPPPPPAQTKKNEKCWSPPGSFLQMTEQYWPGWGGGDVIAIPNPQDKRPVGKRARELQEPMYNVQWSHSWQCTSNYCTVCICLTHLPTNRTCFAAPQYCGNFLYSASYLHLKGLISATLLL